MISKKLYIETMTEMMLRTGITLVTGIPVLLAGGQSKQPCEAAEETAGGVGGRISTYQRFQAQTAA